MKPVELATKTINHYVKTGKIIEPPETLTGVNVKQAGTFVSIKTSIDELRGCIGTIFATKNTVQEEIIHNAIAAATQDPRFYPIEPHELDHLKISVDILHKPEQVSSLDQLDPKIYGVIVSSRDGRRGLLLPNLDGVDTIQEQILICKRKAGISENTPISIERFKVDRYFE